MPTIAFANVLLEKNYRALNYPALYCRATGEVVPDDRESGAWVLADAASYDFTTYFNSLSVGKLKKYTTASAFSLHLEVRGAAFALQQTKGTNLSNASEPVGEPRDVAASEEWESVDIPLTIDEDAVIVGFRLRTQGRIWIRNGQYRVEVEKVRPVELALVTTTFKKEDYITRNVALIKKEICAAGDELSRHFNMYVIDNGRTLDAKAMDTDAVHVIPNDNVGGSGGYARGMLAALDQRPVATHVLLMDDDVAVSPESIRRTYQLLRIVRDEYSEALVSGAMLNYWESDQQTEDVGWMDPKGQMGPLKPGLRMTLFQDLVYNETFRPESHLMPKVQQYAGWWYCCIPVSVIRRTGMPLPFFVRCDDTEYGYRCHEPFMTMQGLCIWHQAFDLKYNPAVERYQSLRNCLIAQNTTGFAPHSDFLRALHNDIRLELKKFGYDNAELCLDAFEDFLKGPKFFSGKGVAEKTFLAANKRKETLVSFDELDRQARAHGLDFNIDRYTRQRIDDNVTRSIPERLMDYATNNGQRGIVSKGEGYAVIPFAGWVYPAGVIRGRHWLIVVDWFNKKGALREKDVDRYRAIMRRYHRDLQYYRANSKRLKDEYSAARTRLTSQEFWRDYLGMGQTVDGGRA